MKREIKFRAWLESGSIMLDWVYLKYKSDVGSVVSGGYEGYQPMQFTGIKDKNGKEIYEGDLINIYATDFSHKFPESIDDIFKAHSLVGNSETHWEIIGNIYENPNLLK